MSHEVKLEYKTEDAAAVTASSASTQLPALKNDTALDGGNVHNNDNDDALEEPGAMYMCASCTALLRLTASSVLQCPNCEHITGSSSVFYKVRTQATTRTRSDSHAMQSRSPATPTAMSAAHSSRASAAASTSTTSPATTTTAATAPVPQCVCATCFTAMPLPRPSLTTLPFQCPQCRLNGADGKVLYTRRAFPTEHSTR